MSYAIPEFLNGKSARCAPLSDYLEAKERKPLFQMFNKLIGTAKKLNPLFFNNVPEFAGKKDEDFAHYQVKLDEQRGLMEELQETADKFRIKIAPLSKSSDSKLKAVGVNTLKGLDALDSDLVEMQSKVETATSALALERARRDGLKRLKFQDVLRNKRLSDAFAAFAARSSVGDEYDYLVRYAKNRIPKTLAAAKEQWALAKEANPTSEMTYWVQDIFVVLEALKVQPNKSLRDSLNEVDEADLQEVEMSADQIWGDWTERWQLAYQNVYRLLERDKIGLFCESPEAIRALA